MTSTAQMSCVHSTFALHQEKKSLLFLSLFQEIQADYAKQSHKNYEGHTVNSLPTVHCHTHELFKLYKILFENGLNYSV